MKDNQLVYMTDEMYLPIQYKGIIAKEPFYKGDGMHSVNELQELCKQFKEYTHQQQVIKQNCMQHIVDLKFGRKLKTIQQLEDEGEIPKVY